MLRVAGVLPCSWLLLVAATATGSDTIAGTSAGTLPPHQNVTKSAARKDDGATAHVTFLQATEQSGVGLDGLQLKVGTNDSIGNATFQEGKMEHLREKINRETHGGEKARSPDMKGKKLISSFYRRSKRKKHTLPFLRMQSGHPDRSRQFLQNNITEKEVDPYVPFQFTVWSRREKKRGKRKRHKVRHGKRRWAKEYKELLHTVKSFGDVFQNMQVKDGLEAAAQISEPSDAPVYLPTSNPGKEDDLENKTVSGTAIMANASLKWKRMGIEPQNQESTAKVILNEPVSSTSQGPFVTPALSTYQPRDSQDEKKTLPDHTEYREHRESLNISDVKSIKEGPAYQQDEQINSMNGSVLHEGSIILENSSDAMTAGAIRTTLSAPPFVPLFEKPDSNATQAVTDQREDSMKPSKRRTINPLIEPPEPLREPPERPLTAVGGGMQSVEETKSDFRATANLNIHRKTDYGEQHGEAYSDALQVSELIQWESRGEGESEGFNARGASDTGSQPQQSRSAGSRRLPSGGERGTAGEQTTLSAGTDVTDRGKYNGGGTVAHAAMLHAPLQRSPSAASKDQGTPNHIHLPSSISEAATGSSSGCYTTNDVVVVVFLTSIVNMVAFVVVTVALCWCSLRARATAPTLRAAHADTQHQDDVEDNMEETAVPEGCLEACLPDISYQRHIARGSSLRPSFVMSRALRPLVTPHPPRLSHAVHELLHNLTATAEANGKRSAVAGLRRRSHSLENLSLT